MVPNNRQRFYEVIEKIIKLKDLSLFLFSDHID